MGLLKTSYFSALM